MSGRICKAIIDGGVRALNEALERILLDEDVHQNRLPGDVHAELIQRLADIDLAAYTGDAGLMPEGGMVGILDVLQEHDLITDEVWQLYHKPEVLPQPTNGPKPDKPKKDKGKARGNGEGL